MLLDIIETTYKLLVGMLERIVRIELVKTGCIDNREEEIAQLASGVFAVVSLQFGFQFIEFLAHLFPHVLTVFPVEAHIAG